MKRTDMPPYNIDEVILRKKCGKTQNTGPTSKVMTTVKKLKPYKLMGPFLKNKWIRLLHNGQTIFLYSRKNPRPIKKCFLSSILDKP